MDTPTPTRRILEISQSRPSLFTRLQGWTPAEVDAWCEKERTENPGSSDYQLSLPRWRDVRPDDRPSIGYAWLEVTYGVLIRGAECWDSGD